MWYCGFQKLELSNKTLTKLDIAAAAPKLWNDLPASIRNTQSLNKFKKAIKTFLFAKAF